MDNVDRRDLKVNFNAFQLALWFMEQLDHLSSCRCEMRHMNDIKTSLPLHFQDGHRIPYFSTPLYRCGKKKTAIISINFLSANAASTHTYDLPSGMHITLPTTALGDFLRICILKYLSADKISHEFLKVLGINVRRALDMFISIITSGHLKKIKLPLRCAVHRGFA